MSDAPEHETPDRPVWLWASLLLNALLIGVLIGGVVNHDHRRGSGPAAGPRGEPSVRVNAEREMVDAVLRKLEGQERREARRDMRRAWLATRQGRLEYEAAARALKDALEADTFDLDTVSTALRNVREAELEVRMALESRALGLLQRLGPEERAEIVRRFITENRGRSRRMGPPGGGPMGQEGEGESGPGRKPRD